ncbi:dienelactone hydrolase family protein [Aquincola sp. S2]|uniref:Dienelactone hydrolase family protein n=1 Tax=Pseudaquabacterium terrae TaxID=2732868 RepID=A0ABX2ES12_9BURK|nr:dienelactone hydrolase family protein [Aquabacterium terrae]NRF71480.1 dienelactone hydrolase family protein [Aquabacterium terrae]
MSLPVHSEWIEISGGFAAHLTLPPSGSGPGLLVLQEIFGVNDHIRAVARQYAMDGFVVLAPDVFWRQAPRVELGYEGADRQRGIELAAKLQPAELVADLQAAATALRGRAEIAGQKIGAIGYCMGGRLAYTAAALAGVDAAVAYYGGGIHNQLELAERIGCPVQFHYAERDDHIPPAAIDKVRAAMAGKPHELHVYAGAMHGFNCWARASYHAPSAALAHGRSLQFLAQALF